MRTLGDASIHSYRWDLVYLHASLLADEDARVTALAPTAAGMLDDVRLERELFERAEEAEIVAGAVRGRRDVELDRTVITFGGVARVVAEVVYERFFGRLSPSRISKAALADEITEVKRLLVELEAMPADDPLRVAHEPSIRGGLTALEAAAAAEEDAEVALAVARARLAAFKSRIDRQRVALYGQLVAILADKSLADSYFRETTAAPAGGDNPPPAPSDDPQPAPAA